MSRELTATPVEWGLFEKEGRVSVFVKLQTTNETFTWWGSVVSEKAREITVKALVTMGFADEDLQYLEMDDALNKNQKVSITVDVEEYNGEVREKVKWINPIRVREKVVLKGVDLKALFSKEFAARDTKIKQRKKVENSFDTPSNTATDYSVDDMPFSNYNVGF